MGCGFAGRSEHECIGVECFVCIAIDCEVVVRWCSGGGGLRDVMDLRDERETL